MKYKVILTRTWCPLPAGAVCSPTPRYICNPKPGFEAGSSPSTSVHHRIMFPLSCREDDLGKGEKKGIQLSQCAPKQRCVCSKAGSTRCENAAMPHVWSLQLLYREQRHGLEVTWGRSAFPLCLLQLSLKPPSRAWEGR